MARHNFIFDLVNVFSEARQIKRQDEESRRKSVRFGILSIIFSIVAVPLSAGAAFLISLMTGGNSAAVLLFIFTIAGILVCAGGAILMLLNGLIRLIAQLTINRNAAGWIALVVFILSVAGCVLMFSMFS